MSPDDLNRVRHMIDAIHSAQSFTEGKNRKNLDENQMLTFALVRAIEIVGEAAARMSPSGREALPSVPWPEIIGMRNRLVHAYFDTNLDILWTTATAALPALLKDLNSAIAGRDSTSASTP